MTMTIMSNIHYFCKIIGHVTSENGTSKYYNILRETIVHWRTVLQNFKKADPLTSNRPLRTITIQTILS